MQVTVTADDLHTATDSGWVVSVTGTVAGTRGVRRVTFNGERERMNALLARVATNGYAVTTVEPWQVLGES